MLSKENLIWIDCEMTGLNPACERIIEIATVVTDSDLNILAEGPVLAVQQSQQLLNNMDDWNTKQHHQSGLIDRVQSSSVSEAIAETQTIEFLKQWVPDNCSPMCGNTIGQDRRFLHRYMPNLESYFHYRNLDVTTLKILAQRWAPKVAAGTNKQSKHLALDDIRDSISELQYYRTHFINA